MFERVGRLWCIVTIPWRSTECMETAEVSSIHRSPQWEDPRVSQGCHKSAKHNQAIGGQSDLQPERDVLKWMKEWQCSYTNEQLSFWTLLHPLMDGGETSSQHLACWLLSVWHWSLALDPPVCPPAPSQLNIGCWIREDCNVSEHQKWIEAYTCALQRLAEASMGWSWTM